MSAFYCILDDEGHVTPCEDVMVWAAWMERHRWIASDVTPGYGLRIMTIFLGLALEGNEQFETTVFPADSFKALMQVRYETLVAARAGHAILVGHAILMEEEQKRYHDAQ